MALRFLQPVHFLYYNLYSGGKRPRWCRYRKTKERNFFSRKKHSLYYRQDSSDIVVYTDVFTDQYKVLKR